MEVEGGERFGDVVLLHGMAGAAGDLAPLGVLRYTARSATLDAQVADLTAAIEARGAPVVTGGVSMGAAVSLAHAAAAGAGSGARGAPAGLVQIAPALDHRSGTLPPEVVGYCAWLADEAERGGSLAALDDVLAPVWEARHPLERLVAQWREFPASVRPVGVEAITVPALVVAWPGDPFHPLATAERLAGDLPDATLVVIDPPATPALPAEPIADALGAFLSRCRG